MLKLPPKEKIPEAYTALEDNRIKLLKNQAILFSGKEMFTIPMMLQHIGKAIWDILSLQY